MDDNTSELWRNISEGTTQIMDLVRETAGPVLFQILETSDAPSTSSSSFILSFDGTLSTKSELELEMEIPGLLSHNINTSNTQPNVSRTMKVKNMTGSSLDLSLEFQIPMYVIIFLLSVLGNVLVIVTVVQNQKMRSVTNVFLLNLSVSDLLLAVFCMPFTLIPLFLKNFIFGEVMCVLIRYMQGVSVAVSCFTLVAISLERYFAICHPLKSRRWQTLSHSYKAIAVCWLCALILMIPLAVYHELVKFAHNRHSCTEKWPSFDGQKAFTVILNLVLLVFPFIIMSWAYSCVCYTLWVGMKIEKQSEKESERRLASANCEAENGVSVYLSKKLVSSSPSDDLELDTSGQRSVSPSTCSRAVTRPFRRLEAHRAMRQSNTERSRAAKKRVIKMLFIIVLEFFVLWTPIYVISTWVTFDLESARKYVTPMTKSLIHLVSYISACCNPITYCFMNRNFRQSFLMAFKCAKKRYLHANRSQVSFTSANTMSTRAATTQSVATCYDKILDSDDISENSF